MPPILKKIDTDIWACSVRLQGGPETGSVHVAPQQHDHRLATAIDVASSKQTRAPKPSLNQSTSTKRARQFKVKVTLWAFPPTSGTGRSDMKGHGRYEVISESGLWSDIVLHSQLTKQVVLLELMVIGESRKEEQHVFKLLKYEDRLLH